MKKWLQIVQKYVFQVSVAVFGILFIYSLIFATPVATLVRVLVTANGIPLTARLSIDLRNAAPNCLDMVNQNETIARAIMILSIVGLVLTGINILYRSHIRKNYYMTNKVVCGAWVLFTFACSIYMMASIIPFMIDFMNLPIDNMNQILKDSNLQYTLLDKGSIVYYIIGIILALILLVFAVGVLMLFIQKIKDELAAKKEVVTEEVNTSNTDVATKEVQ